MLFGREHEQSVIDQTVEAALAGRGAVLALVGEAGMGKSSLLAYAQSRATGMNVLRARGVQPEAQIPFGGLLELLRPAMRSLDQVPAPQAAALEGAMALRPSKAGDRFAIGAATLTLLAAYAERAPLVVLVDDAHWLDGSTSDALLFAARRLAEDPVAVLVAVRDGEPSLLDGTDLPRLRLEGLDLPAARQLLRRHRGVGRLLAPVEVQRLHRETGGNPLALLELSEHGEGSGLSVDEPVPVVVSVAEAYARRFDSLAQGSRQMLILAAASDTGELAALARAAPALDVAVADLGAAEAAGLVVVRQTSVDWRHPLARSAVYGRASPAERRTAHRALANALPDVDDDRRAWHLALAALGPDEGASSALEQAAVRARDRSAYEVASRAFERAALLSSDAGRSGSLLFAAADTAWLAGLGDRAVELLGRAAREADEAALSTRIEHLRGHIEARRGHVEAGRRILVEAASSAAGADPATAVVMLAEALNACFYAGDTQAMQEVAARIPPLAARCTDARSQFFATLSEGMSLVFSGEGSGGPQLIRQAVDLLETSDELRDNPRLLVWAAMGPMWLREASRGRSLIERALVVARSGSLVGVIPYLLGHLAVDDASTDRWPEAEAAFYEAMATARETGQEADLGLGLSRLAILEARRGKEASCRAHVAEAIELSSRLGLGPSEVWCLQALGDLELGLGRAKEASSHYEQQADALRKRAITDVDLFPGAELVEVYLRIGRWQQATEAAAEFWRDAAAKGLPWAMARGARARGLVAPEDEFEPCFLEALEYHDETLDVFETARTRLAFGSRLRRTRRRVRARDELRAAVEAFDRLGAEPWGDIARAELAATGETARRRDERAVAQLTPQELQIALLLADRRTTREAAAALFLSPKTVEYHLRSIYRKLNVSSRDELAAAMER